MNSAVLNQPVCAAQATSLRRLVVAFGFCFLLISIGCNADPSCRRETALLRAEILDIEDKYAVLQSQYESTASQLHQFNGVPIDQTMYGATSNYQDVILNQEIISNGEILTNHGAYPGYVESYPTEQVIYGSPVQSIHRVIHRAIHKVPVSSSRLHRFNWALHTTRAASTSRLAKECLNQATRRCQLPLETRTASPFRASQEINVASRPTILT